MTARQLHIGLVACSQAKADRPAAARDLAVCLWGDPGIGKSALIQAAAEADGVPCETVIGSLREPSDFAGLPVVSDDGVRLEPPAWAKRLHAAQAGYLFLDELSTSPPAVQAAMLGVSLQSHGQWPRLAVTADLDHDGRRPLIARRRRRGVRLSCGLRPCRRGRGPSSI